MVSTLASSHAAQTNHHRRNSTAPLAEARTRTWEHTATTATARLRAPGPRTDGRTTRERGTLTKAATQTTSTGSLRELRVPLGQHSAQAVSAGSASAQSVFTCGPLAPSEVPTHPLPDGIYGVYYYYGYYGYYDWGTYWWGSSSDEPASATLGPSHGRARAHAGFQPRRESGGRYSSLVRACPP